MADVAKSNEAIGKSLETIRKRLQDLRVAFETKADTEKDLRAVAEMLKPLIHAARDDCDMVIRAAKDVRAQLPFTLAGYQTAAASYRQRADGFSDPNLKAVSLWFAGEFDRQAADVPRRTKLTETFIVRLEEVQTFLAETDRCLGDTAMALSIFAAGNGAPETSFAGKVFRKRLEQFIAVVFEYQETLLDKPEPRVREVPKEEPMEPETKPAPQETIITSTEKAPSPVPQKDDSLPASPRPVQVSERSGPVFEMLPLNNRPTGTIRSIGTRRDGRKPLDAGSIFVGEIANPPASNRARAELLIARWDHKSVQGVLSSDDGSVRGRLGLNGQLAFDGKTAHLRTVWVDSDATAEETDYFLNVNPNDKVLWGTWRTATKEGTIRLEWRD
ncbi:MAG: hypothetical protein GC190_20110 [Alphaproteobacteria bacterium]|nr:hypothetical protein [Alphaproteobacteria bacterium]